jgi:hypothetical protein
VDACVSPQLSGLHHFLKDRSPILVLTTASATTQQVTMATPADPNHLGALKDITDPNDTDVLCGRGGAALRHPGNQTYRRLVNLNKGLYITCPKTEKLKISRSIVAAIREQRGRFLEKDKSGNWFDIGDKKAIEKTSQALREGQPKLRQKMAEMGGVQAAMESQYGAGGMYPDQQQQHSPVHQQLSPGAQSDLQRAIMPPPPAMQALPLDNTGVDLHAEMFQRMSLRNLHNAAQGMGMPEYANAPNYGVSPDGYRTSGGAPTQHQQHLPPDQHQQHPYGYGNGQQQVMSHQQQQQQQQQHQQQQVMMGQQAQLQQQHPYTHTATGGASQDYHSNMQPPDGGAGTMDDFDRRQVYASMKFSRPPDPYQVAPVKSGSGGGIGKYSMHSHSQVSDGMPDIHMVSSQLSLQSISSNMTTEKPIAAESSDNKRAPIKILIEGKPGVEMAKVVDHSGNNYAPWSGTTGSRLSVMSGVSGYNSIFSDLSKKIGDVSTHSMAMSEISAFDMREGAYEDDTSHTSNTGFENDAEGFENDADEDSFVQPAAATSAPKPTMDFEDL